MNRRRVAAGLVSVLSFTASGALLARADAAGEPGSAFYGYTVLGEASGLQMVEDRPTANSHPEADAEVPLARVSLLSGPVGYALGSVAWPSALVANAGDLLVFAGNGNVPEQLGPPLNEPVRAETRTGGPQDVSNEAYPGVAMRARVTPAQVAADAVLDGGAAGSATGFGRTETHSTAVLDVAAVTSTARASVKDVALADGAVTIRSVVSRATATSDGVTASAEGTTVVSGMSVGGVPVTVDANGVHVAGNGTPVDTGTVNSVLANLGMHVVLSAPTVTRNGATVSYDSGSLVVSWNPSPDESMTARLGGARVTAGASAADPAGVTSPGTTVLPPATGSTGGAVGGAPVVPDQGLSVPPAQGQQPVTPVVLDPAAVAGPKLLLGAEPVPREALALAVLGALALLVALLRFPSAVVDLPAGPVCPPRSTA